MKSRIILSILAGSLLSTTGTAFAAEPVASLARIDGTVLVSQGEKYRTGSEGMALRQGDRIMAMSTGSAVIKYADGCTYDLDDNEVVTIGATSSCKAGEIAKTEIGPYYAALGANDGSPTPPANLGWLPPAIAGGFIAIAIFNDDDDPISR